MLNLDGGLIRLQAFGVKAIEFDAAKFNWLPSPAPDLRICWVTEGSGWASLAEARGSDKQLVIGGMRPGMSTSDVPKVLGAALDLNMRVVEGYKGGADIIMAAQQGEVDGACFTYASTRISLGENLKSGNVKIIGQVAETQWPGLEQIPLALELAKTEKAKRLIRAGIIGPNDINRLYTLPPEVPGDRVEVMRKALKSTYADPEFNQEMKKIGEVLRVVSVKRIEEVVGDLLSMSDQDKKELKKILDIR